MNRITNIFAHAWGVGLFALVVILLLVLSGCKDTEKNAQAEASKPIVGSIDAKISTLNNDAAATGNAVEKARIERDAANLLVIKYQTLLKDAETDAKQKEKIYEAAKIAQRQRIIYLAAAGLAALGALLFALGIYLRNVHLVYSGIGCTALGACSVTVALFLPYMLAAAIYVSVAAAGFVLLILFRMLVARDKTLQQVGSAVNVLKSKVPEYKTILRQHIDSDSDRMMDAIRQRFNLG